MGQGAMEKGDDVLAEVRERSYKFMQISFSLLSLAAIAAGLAVHFFAPELGLSEEQPAAVANSFLFMGVAYVLTLFAWDSLLKPDN